MSNLEQLLMEVVEKANKELKKDIHETEKSFWKNRKDFAIEIIHYIRENE